MVDMAKDPAEIIPFAEGSPADDLIVQDAGNGNVFIGDPPSGYEEPETSFDQNLTEVIDANSLKRTASDLAEFFETDKASRSEWEERYKEGLKTLSVDGGIIEGDDERGVRGLSQVVHPLIAEAATQFQARAIHELYPPAGPVKTVVVGDPDEGVEEQATRVKQYMNYQIMEEMPEFFPDLDQMLFHLPLIGQTFKKIWFDPSLDRITSSFVQAEDFVVAPDSTDLRTSPRYTQIIKLSRNDYNRFVQAGYYDPLDSFETGTDELTSSTIEDIEGISEYESEGNDNTVTLLEMHTYHSFDGIDGADENDENAVALPYVITIDYDTQGIVSIRRNWNEDDEEQKKREWFISYKFLPGLGFYGFGLYHIIGGLGKVATGSLRALLDSAAFANMQGGFKLKGRIPGGEIEINPGEFADLDATVDDVNKAIMPLPFKEPSSTLFSLLGFVVDAGQRFAAIADLNVGEANNNAPVGTTIALIEQGSRVFSAVHKRLHNSQGVEFRLQMDLNALHLPEEFKFAGTVIYRKDFDDRIDVIPVSDPNVFSSTQRIAQAQAIIQLAQSAPQLHDMYEAYKRMYDAIRVPNADKILKEPEEAARIDPIDENASVLLGKPIKAFFDQNHEAHIAVHLQFMQDPSLGGNPAAQQTLGPILIAHIAEHVAFLYRVRMQEAMSVQLPPMPDIRKPRFKFEDIPPQLDNEISQLAAQVVQQSPQMKPIPGLADQQQDQQDPLQFARQLAELEAEALKVRTEAEIQSSQAKAQSDMAIDQAKAQQALQAQMIKMQTEVDGKISKLQAELTLAQQKMMAETKRDEIKTAAEVQRDEAKTAAEIEREQVKAQNEANIEAEKAAADIQNEGGF
jgi:hypothetical protein|tara:strand:- start:4395 stop:6956 length:2562 start_codon:yes stop_codon:yes gene_type:complete